MTCATQNQWFPDCKEQLTQSFSYQSCALLWSPFSLYTSLNLLCRRTYYHHEIARHHDKTNDNNMVPLLLIISIGIVGLRFTSRHCGGEWFDWSKRNLRLCRTPRQWALLVERQRDQVLLCHAWLVESTESSGRISTTRALFQSAHVFQYQTILALVAQSRHDLWCGKGGRST